jgi:hypothetical protein
MATGDKKSIQITGRVIERKTKQGISNLRVEAWDKDLVVKNAIGSATTDQQGAFVIETSKGQLNDLFSTRHCVLFFKVFRDAQLIISTEASVTWDRDAQVSDLVIKVTTDTPPPVDGGKTFTVSGQVRRADGSPLKDGFVQAFITIQGPEKMLGETKPDPNGQFEISFTLDTSQVSQLANARVVVRVFDSQRIQLAESPSFIPDTTVTVNITIPNPPPPKVTLSVQGQVRSQDRTPISKTIVRAFITSPEKETLLGEANSDSSGNYKITAEVDSSLLTQPSNVHLEARAFDKNETRLASSSLALQKDTTMDIVVSTTPPDKLFLIHGRVLRSDKPLAGVNVQIFGVSPPPEARLGDPAVTNNDGGYEIQYKPGTFDGEQNQESRVQVRVSDDQQRELFKTPFFRSEAEILLDLKVEEHVVPPQPFIVRGLVTNKGGGRFDGIVRVFSIATGKQLGNYATTSGSGQYEISYEAGKLSGTVDTGELVIVRVFDQKEKLLVSSNPFNAQSVKVVDLVVTPSDEEITFIVRGQVLKSDGAFFVGGAVRASHEGAAGQTPLGEGVTDGEGRYSISYSSRIVSGPINLRVQVYDGNGKLLAQSDLISGAKPKEIVNLTIPIAEPVNVVKGRVAQVDGKPIVKAMVLAQDRDVRSEQLLGRAVTDNDGRYEISYTSAQFARAEKNSADLVVSAYQDEKAIAAKQPMASSAIIFNAQAVETVDLVVGNAELRGPSEYEQIEAELRPLLESVPPAPNVQVATLTDEEIAFLAGETGLDLQHIAFFAAAAKLRTGTGLAAEIFYGFARENLPTDLSALLAQNKQVHRSALEDAISANIIPAGFGQTIDQTLEGLQQLAVKQAFEPSTVPGKASPGELLKTSGIPDSKLAEFLTLQVNHEGSPEEFWNNVRANPSLKAVADDLQFTVQAGALTGSYLPMAQQIQAMKRGDSIKTVRDLASRDVNDWKQVITTRIGGSGASAIVGFPPDTPGNNDQEKIENYAASLTRFIEDQFPTAVIASRVAKDNLPGKSDLVAFFAANPDFDLITSRIDKQTILASASNARIANPAALIAQLSGMQRLSRLTPRYSEMRPLMADGIDSAHSIARMGESAFVAQYAGSIGGASAVFERAAQVSATSLHLLANYGAAYNTLDINVLPSFANLKEIPDWQTLFGSLELCECEQCRSIHSPAAYLVDVLSFLNHRVSNNQSAKAVLFKRRSDIGNIALTCDNTNTPVPYVDLVNEVLENAISPTTAVSDVNRQTSGTVEELGANPQYLNLGAYDLLSNQFYPWSLPFNLWIEEARIYLARLAVQRHELMRTFQQRLPLDDPPEIAIVTEYLGLTTLKRQIITGQSATSVLVLWGYPPNSPLSNKVRVFLERTGLTYAEMTDLLKCRWINFQNTLAIVSNDPSSPGSCDIEKQEIANLNFDHAGRILRFVRLWRTLGWTMRELDQAFIALNPPSMGKSSIASPANLTDAEVKQNEEFLTRLAHVRRLHEELGVSIATALSWYALLDTALYTDQTGARLKSLYETLFQNPAVIKLQPGEPDYFALNAGGTELSHANSLGANAKIPATLRGAFQIGDGDLTQLIDKVATLSQTTLVKNLTLDNLSRMYRTVSLAHALKLTIRDFLRIRSLIEINPFVDDAGAINAAATLRFVEVVGKIRAWGWSLDDLEYLLRHELAETSNIALIESDIALVLGALRVDLRKIADENTVPPDNIEQPMLDDLLRKKLSLALGSADAEKALSLLEGAWKDNPATQAKVYQDTLARFATEPLPPPAPSSKSGGGSGPPFMLPNKELVLRGVLKYLRRALGEDLVTRRLSEVLKLSGEMTASLLSDYVKSPHVESPPIVGGRSAMTVFLSDDFITSDSDLTSAVFPEQFTTFTLLHKSAVLINKYNVTTVQLKWLFTYSAGAGWLNPNDFPLTEGAKPAQGPTIFERWERLNDLFALRDSLPGGEQTLSEIFELSRTAATTQADFLGRLSLLTGWDSSELDYLAGASGLNVAFPLEYRDERALTRLRDAFKMSKGMGVSAQQCRELAKANLNADDARNIKQAVRAKCDEAQWLEIAKPLRDELREQQRTALVSYLVAHPDPDPSKGRNWKDANDLYSYFLIDVEMSPCQMTSRIKQAMSSVQLFVQRCLMNLEPEVKALQPEWLEWRWMKNYRVWEANRKVFLYPENWIFPELRDDKSVFFKELENELMQNEVTADTAETALLNYLEKLDTVSRLEICGMYHEEESDANGNKSVDILHVIGRTVGTPHIYYYRRRIDSAYWTPLEKVDLDIEGENLVPIVWNRRLRLFWLTVKKTNSKTENDPNWEVKVVWSEYKNKKWSAKKISSQLFLGRESLHTPQGLCLRSIVSIDDTGGLQIRVFGSNLSLSKTIDVNAKTPWMDTGIDVQGRTRISYKGDQWSAFSSGSDLTDGRGHRSPPSSPFSFSHPFLLMPAANYGALIGKIGVNGSYFYVGNSFEGNLGKGRLYLSINDYLVAFSDNHGSLSIEITGETLDSLPLADFRFSGCASDPVVVSYPISSFTPLVIPRRTYRAYQEFREDTSNEDALYLVEGNFPDSISPGIDPATILNAKTDVLLLKKTPGLYSLLVPHQDGQFTGQRPFFFNDDKRSFFVVPEITKTSSPLSSGLLHVSTINTELKSYRFHIFYHPYLCLFIRELNRYGVDGLFRRPISDRPYLILNPPEDSVFLESEFQTTYDPNKSRVASPYPIEDLDFSYGGSYSSYNWELFFHTPLLIATRLSQNQQFEDAQKWFHYIFDPTDTSDIPAPQKFWKMRPFFLKAATDYQKEQIQTLMNSLAKGDPELEKQVAQWREHPFNPHLIARMRNTAYQKTVVMKYMDNLIAWGDQLFSRDTIESINEATQLYILAAELLGRRPEKATSPVTAPVQTYKSLESRLDEFSNALVQIENVVQAPSSTRVSASFLKTTPIALPTTLYFCIPRNDKMLGYWDTVADRLFKIRHCMNIEGVVRQLPLFEPPIDPGLLVKATAAGLDIGSVLNDLNAPLPHYRFNVMSQKATELCGELKSLGAALLSALEKRDAEALSLLRSTHEINVLNSVRQIKEKQIEEAKLTLEGLEKSLDTVNARYQYYSSREFINTFEAVQLALSAASLVQMTKQLGAEVTAAILHLLPNIKLGALTTIGATYGGANIASSLQAFGGIAGITASMLNTTASLSGTMGSFKRRDEEWKFQADLAAKELVQIGKQIAAAEIRLAIAERDLENHDLQIENAKQVDEFMRGKFTNRELYDWMVSQISGIYFQSYQIAYDVAKRAERTYRFELGLEDSSFIQFGYWDSLKKGLLAGERLYHDIKRMEVAYLDQNKREYEITKHISLAMNDPLALITLRETGSCEIELPEALFDTDYPGHYLRRARTMSLTIPCVVGPYTSINCTLTLLRSQLRKNTTLNTGDENYIETPAGEDPRFVYSFSSTQSMATSGAQNDSGLFELNFRDERYLPFELMGAISRWRIELPKDTNAFDFDTISDVILQLRYTARDGGAALQASASKAVQKLIAETANQPLARLFSLRHEFPTEWHRFLHPPETQPDQSVTLDLTQDRFPFQFQSKTIKVTRVDLFLKVNIAFHYTPALNPPALKLSFGPTAQLQEFTLEADPTLNGLPHMWKTFSNPSPGLWTLLATKQATSLNLPVNPPVNTVSHLNPAAIEDLWILCHYKVT